VADDPENSIKVTAPHLSPVPIGAEHDVWIMTLCDPLLPPVIVHSTVAPEGTIVKVAPSLTVAEKPLGLVHVTVAVPTTEVPLMPCLLLEVS